MSSVPLIVGAVAAATICFILLWASPRSTAAVWIATAFFVPPWVGLDVGTTWSALTAVTIVALVLHVRSLQWAPADVAMLTFGVLVTMLWAIGTVPFAYLVTALLGWLLPYTWGRVVLARISTAFLVNAIAIAATVAAALAIVEFLSGVNWFILIPGTGVEYSTWSTLQVRGDFLRAEGAFGHSIALGAVLAMSAAFVLAARWPLALRITSLALVGIATVMTLSRTGLITFALTVGIAIVLMRELTLRNRLVVLALLAVSVSVATPFLTETFGGASDELAGSAQYRSDLTVLLSQVRVFGAAPDWESLVVGDNYLGHFARSVDSTVVLTLLRYGIVASLFAGSVVVIAIWSSFRHSSARNPAGIAVAAQLPSLIVVALITQFGAIFWFLTGLAIAWSRPPTQRSILRSTFAREHRPRHLKESAHVASNHRHD